MKSSPLPEGPAKSELQLTGSVGLVEGLLQQRGGPSSKRGAWVPATRLINYPGREGTLSSGRGLQTLGRNF